MPIHTALQSVLAGSIHQNSIRVLCKLSDLRAAIKAHLPPLTHIFPGYITGTWGSIFHSTFGLVQPLVPILILCIRRGFQELEHVLQVRRSSLPECCLVLLWLTALLSTLTVFAYDQSPPYTPTLAAGPHLCAWLANLTFVCVA